MATWETIKTFAFKLFNASSTSAQRNVETAALLTLEDIGAGMNWDFKRATTPASVTISSGSSSGTITISDKIKNITRVYLSGREPLDYYSPDKFRDTFEGTTPVVGYPSSYTVRRDTLYIDAEVVNDTTIYLDYFEQLGDDYDKLTSKGYGHVLFAGILYYMTPLTSIKTSGGIVTSHNTSALMAFKETKRQMKAGFPLVQDVLKDNVNLDDRVKAAYNYIDSL